MKQPSLQQFKVWARAHSNLAHAVIQAQAFAQVERERVDAYIKPLFDLFDFYPSDDMIAHGAKRERITDIDGLYMTDLDAPEYLRFLEECDKEHRAHGFTGPKGHCPALVADHLRIISENALLKAGGELLGADFLVCHGDDRKRALDLLLGACLKRDAA